VFGIMNDFVIKNGVFFASIKHIMATDLWLIALSPEAPEPSYSLMLSAPVKKYINTDGSEGLALLYLFAESFGCVRLQLSTDGPTYKGIPTYG
jgi:hypothetical protein